MAIEGTDAAQAGRCLRRGCGDDGGRWTHGQEEAFEDDAPSDARIVDLARATFPRGLYDKETRKRLGLPDDPDEYASYVVELNLQKNGGLAAADNAFKDLYRRTIIENAKERDPVRVSKTYYSCFISMNEARQLVKSDEAKGGLKQRSIYRIWPDFKVSAQVDRSVSTVKGDAALKSYAASGEGVIWAVIDSGIMATHAHFGSYDAAARSLRVGTARDALVAATETADAAKAAGSAGAASREEALAAAQEELRAAEAALKSGDEDAQRLHVAGAGSRHPAPFWTRTEREAEDSNALGDPDANPDMDRRSL
jgi:hypothetical protein